ENLDAEESCRAQEYRRKEDRQEKIRPTKKEDGVAMSAYDSFDPPSGNSPEEPTAVKSTGFSPDVHRADESGALAPEGKSSEPSLPDFVGAPGLASETWDSTASTCESAVPSQPWPQPETVAPARIPHLGHLALLAAFLLFGFLCMAAAMLIAILLHVGGVTTQEQIKSNVYYLLGSEAILYLVTLAAGIPLFPLIWRKSFFAGIHWRGAAAMRLGWRIPALATGCFVLAMLDGALLPGPKHAPIEDLFRTPSAAWLMFAFGVTIAPFFEEIAFRGFLLPSLATACDWINERFTHQRTRPLDEDAHPQWSIAAMIVASILTSIPFALMHAEQQGRSLGPLLAVFAVSLILCAVRLKTRSLAASTIVHACYNFLIFSTMLVSTGGFRHLDKL
ncbi:MAG: CPBP family intramembrane glutamic endopeptidase, partial [Terracidiphilus sp.]